MDTKWERCYNLRINRAPMGCHRPNGGGGHHFSQTQTQAVELGKAHRTVDVSHLALDNFYTKRNRLRLSYRRFPPSPSQIMLFTNVSEST